MTRQPHVDALSSPAKCVSLKIWRMPISSWAAIPRRGSQALDLLLGYARLAQRFAEQDPARFKQQQNRDAGRIVKTRDQPVRRSSCGKEEAERRRCSRRIDAEVRPTSIRKSIDRAKEEFKPEEQPALERPIEAVQQAADQGGRANGRRVGSGEGMVRDVLDRLRRGGGAVARRTAAGAAAAVCGPGGGDAAGRRGAVCFGAIGAVLRVLLLVAGVVRRIRRHGRPQVLTTRGRSARPGACAEMGRAHRLASGPMAEGGRQGRQRRNGNGPGAGAGGGGRRGPRGRRAEDDEGSAAWRATARGRGTAGEAKAKEKSLGKAMTGGPG